MQLQTFNRRRNITIIWITSVIVLAATALVWWNYIYKSPSRVFWAAMANNLQTSSVTRKTTMDQNGQHETQFVRMQLGSTNAGQWLVSIKQTDSNVITESIGTPKAGYVRYIKASTNQKKADGTKYDFSKIVNVWAKADGADATNTLQQLFSQTVLDLNTVPTPPIGNMSAETRANMMDFMKKQSVFKPDLTSVKHVTVDGREAYQYNVKVALVPYIKLMQSFAKNIGLHDLDGVDSSQYQNSKPLDIIIAVDPVSHQLRQIQYTQQSFTQTYTDFGLVDPIKLPSKTISINELQQRLRSL